MGKGRSCPLTFHKDFPKSNSEKREVLETIALLKKRRLEGKALRVLARGKGRGTPHPIVLGTEGSLIRITTELDKKGKGWKGSGRKKG